ncbi:MAG: PVC-type heme-binding CxxCH protein, partial [Planctomycetota bacterium]
ILLYLIGSYANFAVAQTQTIQWETQRLTDKFYAEGATIGDFNRDGKPDFAVGPFWYAGPDFEKSKRMYHQDPFDPHGYSNNFLTYTDDINNDGWDDIVVAGWPGKDASWFENPKGADRYWPKHIMIDVCENESPMFEDLDGDGQRDMVCSAGGFFGFASRNKDNPTAKWTFRRISDNSAGGKYTHGLGVGDVDGDGRKDLLEKSGWWKQPESLDGDPVWKKHPYPFGDGHGPSQMFAYDVDGDGDNDVVSSRNAHGYGLAWFEHVKDDEGEITFKTHQFMGSKPADSPHGVCFSQLHALDLLDINGDGLKDIVTGKRYWAHGTKGDAEPNAPAVLYWFELKRDKGNIEWLPHKIDDDSGVGTDFAAGDLNGDKIPDMVIGNKKGTSVSLSKVVDSSASNAIRFQPRTVASRAKRAHKGLPENAGLKPEAAAAAITVPDGFNVELAASEPMVHQPVAMAWDHRGRVWIAEALTYPIRAPEGEGKDKILILEDDNQDGIFDKRTVFAEGLNLVSGLQVGFGGAWVGAAPYLLFIPDRDGDDRPDSEPIKLLDGFGYHDTHETLNAFIWGPDGWLYGCHGVFTHSKVGKPGTPDDKRTPLNAGVWRYHPVRHQFEVFAFGTSNPWGVDFNDYGQAFITACVIPHMYHVIHGARYQRQAGQHFNPYVFDDIKTIAQHRHYSGNIADHAWWGRDEPVPHMATLEAGGGQAHAGAMIYLGDNWPTQYRNSIFMSNIHGNRINNDRLRRVGSGYVASYNDDLLFGNDRWFRAINLKYAPDGTVYLIDWYDKNACHRTSPQIWDRTNGRIYRVSFGQPQTNTVDLSNSSIADLVELHLHENDWYVRMARRVLQERSFDPNGKMQFNAEQSRELRSGLEQIALHHPNVTRRLRATWTLHACGLLDDGLNSKLMQDTSHKSEYLRAWAIQLGVEDGQPADLSRLAEMARSDPSQLVRLYLASTISQRLSTGSRCN